MGKHNRSIQVFKMTQKEQKSLKQWWKLNLLQKSLSKLKL